jgi:hypothetical protein
MNTNSSMPAGNNSVAAPCSASSTVSAPAVRPHHAGGSRHTRSWLYRRIMRSSVVEPFRKVLRPLIRWMWQPHFGFRSEESRVVPVNLKSPSTFAIVMSVILAPIVFLMLLPLFLILIPVVMFVGVIAIIVPVLQGNMEEGEHHSFASHVMH